MFDNQQNNNIPPEYQTRGHNSACDYHPDAQEAAECIKLAQDALKLAGMGGIATYDTEVGLWARSFFIKRDCL